MGKKLLSLKKIKISKLNDLINIRGGSLLSVTDTLVFTYGVHREGQSTKTKPIGDTSFCNKNLGY